MRLKKIVRACFVLCITAIFTIAVCGCEDLGDFDDTEEYYSTFMDEDSENGEVFLINGSSKAAIGYSIKDFFYNKESKENFLEEDDGTYHGVDYSDYVYMAIPLSRDIEMDSIALYLKSHENATLYINVYLTDGIPSNYKAIEDNVIPDGTTGGASDGTTGGASDGTTGGTSDGTTTPTYDDPDYQTRVGDIVVYLEKDKWNSFVLDTFIVDKIAQKSIKIQKGQYILLQIRNNSGVRDFDEKNNIFVDPQTKLPLEKANITMTNLLVRALQVKEED